jgi:hypothetical protein
VSTPTKANQGMLKAPTTTKRIVEQAAPQETLKKSTVLHREQQQLTPPRYLFDKFGNRYAISPDPVSLHRSVTNLHAPEPAQFTDDNRSSASKKRRMRGDRAKTPVLESDFEAEPQRYPMPRDTHVRDEPVDLHSRDESHSQEDEILLRHIALQNAEEQSRNLRNVPVMKPFESPLRQNLNKFINFEPPKRVSPQRTPQAPAALHQREDAAPMTVEQFVNMPRSDRETIAHQIVEQIVAERDEPRSTRASKGSPYFATATGDRLPASISVRSDQLIPENLSKITTKTIKIPQSPPIDTKSHRPLRFAHAGFVQQVPDLIELRKAENEVILNLLISLSTALGCLAHSREIPEVSPQKAGPWTSIPTETVPKVNVSATEAKGNLPRRL